MANKLLATQSAITYFQEPVVILRQDVGAGWDADTGQYVRDQANQLDIMGTVINVSDEDLQQVPEAERTEGMKTLYTMTPVYTTNSPGQKYSDLMEHGGLTYRLIKVLPRFQGEFYKAVCGLYAYDATNDLAPVVPP